MYHAVRLGSRLALMGLGLAAAVLLAEAVLRAFPDLMPAAAVNRAQLLHDLGDVRTRPDPYIGFLYPPNYRGSMRHHDAAFTFQTDALGFRNSGPWPERAGVVALGDSLTFGFGVPDGDSWVALAARSLGDVAIVNLALPGLGPLQQARVYRVFGAALRPKVVLLGFFPGNDFWDTAKFLAWLKLPDRSNYLLWRDFGIDEDRGLGTVEKVVKTSYVRSLLWAVANPNAEAFDGAVAYEMKGGRMVLFPESLRRLKERASPGRAEFDETFRALKELDDRVRSDHGRLVVVLLPSKEYVYLPLHGAMAEDPMKAVYRALDELQLSYLDLTPRFRERAAAGERLFFEVDGHPNARGYALIADAVVEYLRHGASGTRGRTLP